MPFLAPSTSGVICTVRVTPRAGRTAIAGIRDDVLLVRLAAAPVDGAANEALVELLADVFRLAKRDVAIVSGQTNRVKRVALTGLTATDAAARLRPHLDASSRTLKT
jgi:uncharacterized protein (TIGR00251 family)